jgi:acetyl/propionyl-CoA carboxylase alpha subunit
MYYDPLIGKLCTWALTREAAIARMSRALDELRIDGLPTSVSFHRKVMEHEAFRKGELHTGFLEQFPELLQPKDDPWLDEIAVVAAAVAHFRNVEASAMQPAGGGSAGVSGWKAYGRARGWRR